MLEHLQQSLSYIWGKEIPINSMNRVDAIHKLIENFQANEKEIDSLLARTEGAWNGVKTFLSKIRLTVWVLFWEKHRLSLNEACEKLKKIINKVVVAVENVFPKVEEKKSNTRLFNLQPVEEDDEYEYVVSDDDEEEEGVDSEIIAHIRHEIAVLKVRLEQFDKKNGNRYKLENEVNQCEKEIRNRIDNIPLIDEFDKKSLALFEIQDKISKQKLVKGKYVQKLKSLSEAGKRKVQVQESALKEQQDKAKVLEEEIKELEKLINDNYLSYCFRVECKDLTLDEMIERKKTFSDLLDQRKKIEDELKQKENQASLV